MATSPLVLRPALPRLREVAGVLAAVALAIVGAALLRRGLGGITLPAVTAAVLAVPAGRIALSLAFTAGSYLVLVGVDAVALACAGARVPWRVTARAAFTSSALGFNLGFAAFTGGAARMKLYGRAGVSKAGVARVIALSGLAFWSGTCIIAGAGLAAQSHLAGAALVAAPLVAIAVALKARIVRRSPHVIALPLLGTADVALSALALFLLMPGLTAEQLPQFCVIYALAILAGLVSHVPGGLGVFEGVVVAGLHRFGPPATIAGALLAYRAIYYLLPLAAVLLLNAVAGLRAGAARLRPVLAALRLVLYEVAPPLMGALAFAGGLVLLLSGAVPAAHGRMHVLVRLLPLPFIEASHLSASLVGTALLLVAPSLADRLESGLRAARLLFMLGAAFSLAKGLDFEEAVVMLTLVGFLQLSAPAFYRRTAEAFSSTSKGWLIAAAAALAISALSGIHAYRHVPYDNDLWWEFALRGDAPRFLRASFAAGILLAAYAWARLLRGPAPPAALRALPPEVFARAAAASPRSDAALALTGDKHFLVHPAGDAFVMVGVRGRTWSVMGDPVGPRERWADLAWELRRHADAAHARLCLYQLSAEMLPLAIELGLKPIKYGEEAIIAPGGFTLEGSRMKSLRGSCGRAAREGLAVRIIPSREVAHWLPRLAKVSDEWLVHRRAQEKSFSLGHFSEGYLCRSDVAVVVRGDAPDLPLAFANLWRSGDGAELSVDLMRHAAGAPPGTMDLLFTELVRLAGREGCSRFNLGLAPLSGVRGGSLAPGWARLTSLAFALDIGTFGLQGLRRYKDKFAPEWQPRFIAVPPGIPGIRALVDLVSLISSEPSPGRRNRPRFPTGPACAMHEFPVAAGNTRGGLIATTDGKCRAGYS